MSTTPLINATLPGLKLSFFDDGTVTAEGQAAAGTWRTHADAPDRTNALRFAFPGAAEKILPLAYALTADNQLTVAIPSAGVAPVTLQGRIVVEENRNFCYYLIGDDGWDSPTHLAFYVYGDLAIDPAKNQLTVTGPGAKLVVQGDASAGALVVSQGNNATDLLEFNATTRNPLAAGGSVDAKAEVSLEGNWDLYDNQLALVMNYDSKSGTPTYYIGVAGRLKGVAAGFELYSDGGSPRLLLTLQGRVVGANQKGEWQLSLGYAQKKFTAALTLDTKIQNQGSTLAIRGQLKVGSTDGGSHSLDLDLSATWRMSNGQFNFVVEGSNGKYSLALSGELKLDNWNVTFEIKASPGSSKNLTVSLGVANPGSQLHSQLQLYFSGNQKNLKASLSLKLTFVDGFLLP